MSNIPLLIVAALAEFIAATGWAAEADPSVATPKEGIAVAIVYDTSGSMRDVAPNGAGGASPKYQIANRALSAIIDRLQAVSTGSPKLSPIHLETGLFIFRRGRCVPAVPFGTFKPEALRGWLKGFASPEGATPLGQALSEANQAVQRSKLSRKHVLVITDGENTAGPNPASVFPRLKAQASQANRSLAVHFVAFDVAARVFDPLKKQGATVVGASDEKQLNAQLEFILQKKILLEEEEPPPAGGARKP